MSVEEKLNMAQQMEKCDLLPVEDEINIVDLLLVLLKHKKKIFLSCVITFVCMCIITLLMPNIYVSTARILPPQDTKNNFSSMLGGISDLAALAGISVGGGSSGELYVGMLKSRNIADAIIDKYHLMDVYEEKYRTNVYETLTNNTSISLDKDNGIVSISVEDENPEQAASMVNQYLEELKRLNVKLNLGTVGREREFLEKRLVTVKSDLRLAEEKLKAFQEFNTAIRIDDQANAIIDAIASLKGVLASKEVELGVLLSYQTRQNPQAKAVQENIEQLKTQIRMLEEKPLGKKAIGDIFIATSEVPELGIQYARLLREYKIQETIFQLLTKQYEVAKINEARDTSTIQILDQASVPDKKTKPKRALIVSFVTITVGFLSVIVAFVMEFFSQLSERDPDRWYRIKMGILFSKKAL